MGQTIWLAASDGHRLSAYEAAPHAVHHRGGLVVIQEAFGVNAHIRSVCDAFAEAGYYVIAAALFDREAPGTDLGYGPEVFATVRPMMERIGFEAMLRDVEAARNAAASAGRVGVVGYCLGGSLAWLSATRLDGIAAASCYYGSRIAATATERPRAPVQIHLGDRDGSIPAEDIATIRAAVPPEVEVFVYADAPHAFNNADRPSNFHPEAARLALERTVTLLRQHVG